MPLYAVVMYSMTMLLAAASLLTVVCDQSMSLSRICVRMAAASFV